MRFSTWISISYIRWPESQYWLTQDYRFLLMCTVMDSNEHTDGFLPPMWETEIGFHSQLTGHLECEPEDGRPLFLFQIKAF